MIIPTIGVLPAQSHTVRRQALLRNALVPFVDELRLVDFADLAAYSIAGQFANLDDIVQSSLELFYRPCAFAFGWSARITLAWRALPALALEMEFSGGGMTAFFVLHITADSHHVDIRSIVFAQLGGDPDANTERLANALGDARQGSDKSASAR